MIAAPRLSALARVARMRPMLRLLTLCGSLRAGSSNATVLEAAARLLPTNVGVDRYEGVANLPHFNPDDDRDGTSPPASVADWRARLRAADAVLICSPEYAHGVPGALKNALDWIVSSGEFMDKPTGLITASAHSRHAPAQLAETLGVMMARLVAGASPTIALSRNAIDAQAILAEAALREPIEAAVAALIAACRPAADG